MALPGGGVEPAGKDGGASAAAVPHDVFALFANVMSIVPPLATNASDTHGLVLAVPFTDRLWMYGVLVAACGALIVIVLPLLREITTWVNSGLASTRSARP